VANNSNSNNFRDIQEDKIRVTLVEKEEYFLNMSSDLSAIARGLLQCSFDVIQGDDADGLLMGKIFASAKAIMALPVCDNGLLHTTQGGSNGGRDNSLTVQEWSCSQTSGIDLNEVSQDSAIGSLSNVAIYLSRFSSTIHGLAKILTDENALKYVQCLATWMEKGDISSINLNGDTATDLPPLVKSVLSMMALQSKAEKNVFQRAIVHKAKLKNTYLETKLLRESPEKGANVPRNTNTTWASNLNVRRSAKEFIAHFIRLS